VNAGDLANTPRQFPVPARELETLRRQLYTFRGADSVSLGARAAATMLSLSMAGPSGRAQLLRAAEVGEVGKIASLYRRQRTAAARAAPRVLIDAARQAVTRHGTTERARRDSPGPLAACVPPLVRAFAWCPRASR
jgi:demethoxyubiquinone hydroxylase (CLK1/Coq7/Cat5 family)